MAVLKCEWHLCVRVRKWVTAMGTVLMCVVPLACNSDVVRVGPACNVLYCGLAPCATTPKWVTFRCRLCPCEDWYPWLLMLCVKCTRVWEGIAEP